MEKIYKHKEFLFISFVLLLAAFLRVYRLSDYMTFLGDEGRDALIVYEILHGKFTLLGPMASVGGFFMGPIYYYLIAPFLWLFNYDPSGPAFMVAVFGVMTVLLVYKTGKFLFGFRAGVVAATLYAISPLTVAYSRSSWNPNLMPFFSLIILFTLYYAFRKSSKKLFILVGILYGIAFQLHYIELFLGAVIIFYLFLMMIITKRLRSKERLITLSLLTLRDYILIFFGFVIGWSPFLAFEARHGFLNIRSIFNFIVHSEEVGAGETFTGIVGNVFFRLFGRLLTRYPPPDQIAAGFYTPVTVTVWTDLTLALAIFCLSVFLYQYYRQLKDKTENSQKLSIIFVWLVIGIFLFGLYKKSIYDYYFEFMFPLPFLLAGNGFSFLFDKGKWFRMLSLISLIALIIVNLQGIPFLFQPNRQKDQVKQIAEFVLSKTDNKPYNFALITGSNSDHAYRYFFKLANRDPVIIQNPQIDEQRKSVTNQLLVVCEDTACQPLGNGLWEVAGFGRANIVGKWDVSVVKVYKLVPYAGVD